MPHFDPRYRYAELLEANAVQDADYNPVNYDVDGLPISLATRGNPGL